MNIKKIKPKIRILKDTLGNFFSSSQLSYIVEPTDWVIKYVGEQLTDHLNRLALINGRTTTSPYGIRNQIVHLGSLHTFLTARGLRKTYPSNKNVLTVFHVIPERARLAALGRVGKYFNIIHTSCLTTKKVLLDLGIAKENIVVIPLGVDLSLFKPASREARQRRRAELGIPDKALVVGSFQKDGVGWGEGLTPKPEKGPDVFVEVVDRLAKNYPVFVLLVGPARGYVKKNLAERNIPFKDTGFLRSLREVTQYYRALDLYLISSRIEGGPLQILEAWASGVPVVSTRAGMVPDIASHGETALLAGIGDIDQLTKGCRQIVSDSRLKRGLVQKALLEVKKYSWTVTARKYYEKIYSKI